MQPPPAKKPETHNTIAGYQVISKIGAGGTAVVFKARETKTNLIVALKIPLPQTSQNPPLLARFKREAELLTKFRHGNIVKGLNHGMFSGMYFMALEYIEGKSVQELINKLGPLPEKLAMDIILQVARALDYIEKEGIIHRDIKPDNLMLTPGGLIKLCDLGFAQPIGTASGKSETTSGTPQYMSPEQVEGKMNIDIRSDIYSLGATFYHMVTGKVPFQGTDNMEIMAQQVMGAITSGEIKNHNLSPFTLYVIEKMMAKDKDFRYQNPAEIIEDISEQLKGFDSLEYHPE
jgi:eukaryotic-like serine/threonine-protein kinase